jgi:predicted alpha-1,2-mannosidase
MKRKSTSSFVVIKLSLILVAMLAVTIRAVDIAQKDFTQYVNPFIGTGGHGHTFPGAVFPFGMIQLSPDTREANWDGSSGYHYSDSKIYGFSHTHLSGTGIPDGCDVLLTPIMGEIMPAELGADAIEGNFASEFSHSAESASPGYYSVFLSKYSINAELTATQRVGLHRYTFQKSGKAHIILDLDWRDKLVGSDLKIIGNNKIEGYRQSSSWAKDQRVYFVIEFSRPFNDVLTNKSNSLASGC